jgi:hypothetical protein
MVGYLHVAPIILKLAHENLMAPPAGPHSLMSGIICSERLQRDLDRSPKTRFGRSEFGLNIYFRFSLRRAFKKLWLRYQTIIRRVKTYGGKTVRLKLYHKRVHAAGIKKAVNR